jgi:carboxyl-terminal processing protease
MKYKYFLLVFAIAVIGYLSSHYEIRIYPANTLKGEDRKRADKLRQVVYYINEMYVDSVDWNKTTQSAIEGALENLDPHSVYINREDGESNDENFQGKYQGIGIQYDVIDEFITVISVTPGSPSDHVGLMAGDKIINIGGKPAQGMAVNDVPRELKGPKGSKVTIRVLRNGLQEPFDLEIIRDEIPIFTIHTWFKLDEITGYIWVNRFAHTTADELEEALRTLEERSIKRLILDLRGNGGGLLRQAVEVAGKFLDGHKKVVYTQGRLSRFNDEYYSDDFGSSRKRDYPLIVLIDHGSASASEIVAGAIQDYDRGLIAGTTSFGKGLVQNEFVLNDSSRLRLTISKYYTPSGRLIQRPYKDRGLEEYYASDEETVDSLTIAAAPEDTITSRPVYFTASGRKVFGGGGIKPDVEIKYTSHSKSPALATQMIQKRVFFETIANYLASGRRINKAKYDEFLAGFKISPELLANLRKTAVHKGIEIGDDPFSLDVEFLQNRLKAEIARQVWGMNAYYQVILQFDNQLAEAVQLFDNK